MISKADKRPLLKGSQVCGCIKHVLQIIKGLLLPQEDGSGNFLHFGVN